MARINIKTSRPQLKTAEGAPAVRINSRQQLRRLVLPCLLWEDGFYVDGKTVADSISDAVAAVSLADAAAVAVEAREVFHLRHVPLWVALAMVRKNSAPGPTSLRTSLVSDTIARVIQRPDEAGELLAMYWKDQKPEARSPIANQLKKGLARAFEKFDRYQLSKYAAGGEVRLRDVMFLTHPHPSADLQETYRQLADQEVSARDAGTWEARLSSGADKRTTFEDLIRTKKLGYMALLRNLRKMTEEKVDEELIRAAILERRGARRVLPFRYVAAARAVPQYERELDKALCASIDEAPPWPGTTWVLVDVSGSMNHGLAAKSALKFMDAAATLAAVIPGRVRMFSFSNQTVEVPPRRGMAGVDAIIRSQGHGGTMLGAAVQHVNRMMSPGSGDRLVVITDEQSHDRVPDPVAERAYMINVATNKNGVGYGRWTHIDGFSEGVLRFIREVEREGVSQQIDVHEEVDEDETEE